MLPEKMLLDFGFSTIDIDMMILCPFFGAIGGLMHFLMLSINLRKWPVYSGKGLTLEKYEGNKFEKMLWFFADCIMLLPQFLLDIMFSKPFWILARISLSSFTGLMVALYFVGIFPSTDCNPTGPARVLALCIVIGYMAPALWLAKEHWFLMMIAPSSFKKFLVKMINENIEEQTGQNDDEIKEDNDTTAP